MKPKSKHLSLSLKSVILVLVFIPFGYVKANPPENQDEFAEQLLQLLEPDASNADSMGDLVDENGHDADSEDEGDRDTHPTHHGKSLGLLKKLRQAGSSAGITKGDFNKDGFADLAVGVPLEDITVISGSKTLMRTDAGAVSIIYGSADGLAATAPGIPASQFWSQDSPGILDSAQAGDKFGAALAAGDFNSDGLSDLAIAVPGEVTTIPGTSTTVKGGIQILYGSSTSGLGSLNNQFLRADELGLTGVGNSLVWADFNGDGIGDLAVEGSLFDPAVSIIFGSAAGLNRGAIARQQFAIPNAGSFVEGVGLIAELSLAAGKLNSDAFDDLVVGTPFATVNGKERAGAVRILLGSPAGITQTGSQVFNQDTPDVPEEAETNDQFGLALAVGDFDGDGIGDLAVGVPSEDVRLVIIDTLGGRRVFSNALENAGSVHIIRGSTTGLTVEDTRLIHAVEIIDNSLATIPPPGSRGDAGAENNNNFGAALAAGDFNDDGFADLAVGAPNNRLGSSGTTGGIAAAGSVDVYYGKSGGLETFEHQFWTEDNSSQFASATPVAGDRFGSALTAWNFGRDDERYINPVRSADLAIGIPGKDVGGRTDAGAVRVIYGSVEELSTHFGSANDVGPSQLWHQDVTDVPDQCEAGDQFGSALY